MAKVGEHDVYVGSEKAYEPETQCRVRIHELLKQRALQMHKRASKLLELVEWFENHHMPAPVEETLWDIMHGLDTLGR